jgi:hypothetical protein
VVILSSQAELFQIVGTTHPGRSLADLLDRGQQEANQDGDDRNHDQQLDQREPILSSRPRTDHSNAPKKENEGCERTFAR